MKQEKGTQRKGTKHRSPNGGPKSEVRGAVQMASFQPGDERQPTHSAGLADAPGA
ncbi:hypothetical protein QP463_08845 [Actinotignum schaalii]|nr:hypothetical protein [Actinotignum schaalii]